MYWWARTLGYSYEAAEQQVVDFVKDVWREERDALRSPRLYGYPKKRVLPRLEKGLALYLSHLRLGT